MRSGRQNLSLFKAFILIFCWDICETLSFGKNRREQLYGQKTLIFEEMSHLLHLYTEVAVLVDELWNLLLQSIVFLHQELIHCCQLPIHSLETWSLFSLLFSASAQNSLNRTHNFQIAKHWKPRIWENTKLRIWKATEVVQNDKTNGIKKAKLNCLLHLFSFIHLISRKEEN